MKTTQKDGFKYFSGRRYATDVRSLCPAVHAIPSDCRRAIRGRRNLEWGRGRNGRS